MLKTYNPKITEEEDLDTSLRESIVNIESADKQTQQETQQTFQQYTEKFDLSPKQKSKKKIEKQNHYDNLNQIDKENIDNQNIISNYSAYQKQQQTNYKKQKSLTSRAKTSNNINFKDQKSYQKQQQQFNLPNNQMVLEDFYMKTSRNKTQKKPIQSQQKLSKKCQKSKSFCLPKKQQILQQNLSQNQQNQNLTQNEQNLFTNASSIIDSQQLDNLTKQFLYESNLLTQSSFDDSNQSYLISKYSQNKQKTNQSEINLKNGQNNIKITNNKKNNINKQQQQSTFQTNQSINSQFSKVKNSQRRSSNVSSIYQLNLGRLISDNDKDQDNIHQKNQDLSTVKQNQILLKNSQKQLKQEQQIQKQNFKQLNQAKLTENSTQEEYLATSISNLYSCSNQELIDKIQQFQEILEIQEQTNQDLQEKLNKSIKMQGEMRHFHSCLYQNLEETQEELEQSQNENIQMKKQFNLQLEQEVQKIQQIFANKIQEIQENFKNVKFQLIIIIILLNYILIIFYNSNQKKKKKK
ncbi:hypothetical protein PPERSA_08553 [Pseudocohnilembus persalinus]|uniref:Transmembrane protein n=1 Tax=Pseudocohnilembus persalinus TaxID=266149 RepID=A0A0V0R6L3_PSEPJ|nr:hypothetical protein PPERSA_08553 [Pseudocohnilembus persalinus]|eukprot:KRX10150.1 hypothetical protein PPERSA_08553 [Pseudocohnilembus persalinus]